jgi:hypothetical protein
MDKPVKCKGGNDQPRPDNRSRHRSKSSRERRPPAAETHRTRIVPFQTASSFFQTFFFSTASKRFPTQSGLRLRRPGGVIGDGSVTESHFWPPSRAIACASTIRSNDVTAPQFLLRPDIVTWIYDSQVQPDTYAESLWRRATPGSSYVLSAPQTA